MPITERFTGLQPTAAVPVLTLPIIGAGTAREDTIAVEAPLELRIGGKPITVMMRTPGHDEELVTGFLFGEGLIADADDIHAIEHVAENVLNVRLTTSGSTFTGNRLFYSNSSCGVCGKVSLAALEVRGQPMQTTMTVARRVLATMPDRLRAAQPLFACTGGVHASGLFTPDGDLIAVREDVGRHNALDKLIGWALNEGLIPLTNNVLLVSGRVSYELVQKAVAAGIPLIAAVGAPSSLAIELAEKFNITLVGFLRESSMNIYANATRVTLLVDGSLVPTWL